MGFAYLWYVIIRRVLCLGMLLLIKVAYTCKLHVMYTLVTSVTPTINIHFHNLQKYVNTYRAGLKQFSTQKPVHSTARTFLQTQSRMSSVEHNNAAWIQHLVMSLTVTCTYCRCNIMCLTLQSMVTAGTLSMFNRC